MMDQYPFICTACGTECSTTCYPTHAKKYTCHNSHCSFNKPAVMSVANSMSSPVANPPDSPSDDLSSLQKWRATTTIIPSNLDNPPWSTKTSVLSTSPMCEISKEESLRRIWSHCITEIEPGLFIGSMEAVNSKDCLKHNDITAVVSLISHKRVPFHDKIDPHKLHPLENYHLKDRLVIAIDDHKSENILKHLEGACDFIDGHLNPPTDPVSDTDARESEQEKITLPGAFRIAKERKGRVLVHCTKGISRSATVVIAYLMRKNGKSTHYNLRKILKKRFIRPNCGFLDQLIVWEETGFEIFCNKEFFVPKVEYEQLVGRLEAYKRVETLEKSFEEVHKKVKTLQEVFEKRPGTHGGS